MFALIIAIIAIALTVYLAVSTLFYGGDALSNGSARAIASSFINQGQQVNGAHTLYKNDNAGAKIGTNLDLLVTGNYLSSKPVPQAGNAWAVDESFDHDGDTGTTTAALTVIKSTNAALPGGTKTIADEVCKLIQDQAGTGSATFGCVGASSPTDTTDNVVWYRI